MLFARGAQAQDRSAEQRISQAKTLIRDGVNTAQRGPLNEAKSVLRPLTGDPHHGALVEYYIGYIDYEMGVAIERMDKDRAVPYLDSAVEHLNSAIRKQEGFAEAWALLSGCYGVKIGLSPFKAIILGPKSGSAMDRAKSIAPENPRVSLIGAIGTYNTPAMFGGGKEKGLAGFVNASQLFARWKEPDSLQPDWGKEEVYAWIGIAHLDVGDTILAKRAFEKALQINPEYGWVSKVLLPRVSDQPERKQ
jgi:tetratricopeptide (TPR) repeat protein